MRELTWNDFADAAGKPYAIAIGGHRIDLTLDRVEQLPPSPREAGSFRLEFVGPPDPVLPQAIYPLTGEAETHEIFLVPIARDAAGARYEAVFF